MVEHWWQADPCSRVVFQSTALIWSAQYTAETGSLQCSGWHTLQQIQQRLCIAHARLSFQPGVGPFSLVPESPAVFVWPGFCSQNINLRLSCTQHHSHPPTVVAARWHTWDAHPVGKIKRSAFQLQGVWLAFLAVIHGGYSLRQFRNAFHIMCEVHASLHGIKISIQWHGILKRKKKKKKRTFGNEGCTSLICQWLQGTIMENLAAARVVELGFWRWGGGIRLSGV